jgi:Uma2 family endonuclease
MAEARRSAPPMTVAEFRRWADRQPGRWELVAGQPRAMAPASATHGLIQAQAAYLILRHLDEAGSLCRAVTEAAVVPASFKRSNARVTDLAVTCEPPAEDGWDVTNPVFLLEVLSPSNEQDTRDNVWAYMTIPSVRQVLLLHSTAIRGEMFERRRDETWSEEAVELAADDTVRIEPIGFSCALREFYRRTGLAS